jgi:hypothetical protein
MYTYFNPFFSTQWRRGAWIALACSYLVAALPVFGQLQRLTGNATQEGPPDVSGNTIAWAVNGQTIQLFNTLTRTYRSVPNPSLFATDPVVGSTSLVWYGGEIFQMVLGTGQVTQLTANGLTKNSPVIWQDVVVWPQLEAGSFHLYGQGGLLGGQPVKLTLDEGQVINRFPALANDLLVWLAQDANGVSVKALRLSTGERRILRTSSADGPVFRVPKTDGQLVAWETASANGLQTGVELYNWDNQQTLTVAELGTGSAPMCSGGRAVWAVNTPTGCGVVSYSLAGLRVDTLWWGTGLAEAPWLDGRFVTWLINGQVYARDIETNSDVIRVSPLNAIENRTPRISGRNLVFQSMIDDDQDEVYWYMLPTALGLTDNRFSSKLTVYPNPIEAGGTLRIHPLDGTRTPISMQLRNSLGEVVYQLTGQELANGHLTLPDSVHTGLYFLGVDYFDEVRYHKIMVY